MTGKNSDGCSFVSDHDSEVHSCCDQHDRLYTAQVLSRWTIDNILRQCIAESGHPTRAWIYWIGVRLGGWVPWIWIKIKKAYKAYHG